MFRKHIFFVIWLFFSFLCISSFWWANQSEIMFFFSKTYFCFFLLHSIYLVVVHLSLFLRASPGKPNRNWCSTTKNWLRRRSSNHSRTGVTLSFVFVILEILEIFMCVFVQGFSEDVFSQFDPVLGNKVRKTFSLPSNQVLLLKKREIMKSRS